MMDVVCLGDILMDMFPAEVGRRLAETSAFHPKPGGSQANVAVALARLGVRTAFIGKVGEDAFGQQLVEVMRREGVDVRGMRFDAEARTTLAFIAMPDVNTPEFVFYRNPGADTRLRPDELDRALLQTTRAFQFGGLNLTTEPTRGTTVEALRLARASGALISFDANYRPALWPGMAAAREQILAVLPHVHVLKANEVELEVITGTRDVEKASEAILRMGIELCVVTLGGKGSFFRVAGGSDFVPARAVETVDATGCGDAFVAGLLSRLVVGVEWRDQVSPARLRECLRYANAVGAVTATKVGAMSALPTAAQVEAFLAHG